MPEFRWMAPIQVGFTSQPGVQERDLEAYENFWDRVRDASVDEGWVFPRATDPSSSLGWSSAAGEVMLRPLAAVEGTVERDDIPQIEQLSLVATDLRWTLFDHGVLLAEGRVSGTVGGDGDSYEDQVQALGEQLVAYCADRPVRSLLELMRSEVDHERFVDLSGPTSRRPLWVTRALLLDPDDVTGAALARAWVSDIDEQHARDIEEVIAGTRPYLAQWLNHVHRSDQGREVEAQWESLRRAQFFWASMQYTDEALRHILAWAMADDEQVSLASLRAQLWHVVDEAQELLMVRADVQQRASRTRNAQTNGFLEFWEYEELLERPVREKVDYCRDRLAALQEERAARTGLFTDVILMSIGVTSLLATAIALVQFGRQARQDATQSSYDLGSGSITTWLSSQSMDAILLISCVASFVLIGVFIWKRRQSVA